MEPNPADKLSFISVRNSLKEELPVRKLKVADSGNSTFYSVDLKQPVSVGRTGVFTIELVSPSLF